MDPRLLYTLDPEVWSSLRGTKPVLLHLLEGYVDAASVTRGLAEHLLENCPSEVVVEFDHDQLHDYRSRRPVMTFDNNQWVGMNAFSLKLYRLTDEDGRYFLLLHGPEPDTQWMRFAEAILDIASRLEVSNLVTAQGVPMGVPHTRPTLVTAHSTDPELAQGNPIWIDRIQIPGSWSAMLEYLAGREDRLAMGFVAHVPHYLAQSTFHQATLAVLARIKQATGLALPSDQLEEQLAGNLAAIHTEVSDEAEFPQILAALEEQYDQLREHPNESVPSAEEIGAAVERFLAEQDDDDGSG